MPYRIVTVPYQDSDPWGAMLLAELEDQEVDGWVLTALTIRTVPVPHTLGLGTPTRYEPQLVVVLHKPGG